MSLNSSLDETLREAIEPFIDKGLIVAVLQVLKSGKEATVYACRGGARIGGRLVAVKVYRPLEHRQFRNDSAYRAGRVILSGRVKRAVASGSEFGKEAAFGMWKGHEAVYLRELHAAGLDVPRVLDSEGSAIVMQYLGDEEGAAPQLRSVRLSEEQAARTWHRMVQAVRRMMSINRVHGDLSPYNLLWFEEKPWIIDVPQMMDPRENPNARTMLERDLENLWKYMGKFTAVPDPWKLADAIWWEWKEGRLG